MKQNYIKNFSQFINEQYDAESNDSLMELITNTIDENIAILEALGSLQGLPSQWMKIITDKSGLEGGLGGENSIRTTVPIKATQKKKVFGYLKNGYEGTPVLALMGFTEGHPAFMIYKDRWAWSNKAGKWKLMIGDAVYDRKIRKSRYDRIRGYISWEQIKNKFGEKDIIDALPEGEFEMQLITIDPERMRLRKERTEIAKMAGAETKNGIQKSTVYKYILGKVKPQVDAMVQQIVSDVKNNIVGSVDDIFNPDIESLRDIDISGNTIEKLKEIVSKLKDARNTIDGMFPFKGNLLNPKAAYDNIHKKDAWSYDVKRFEKLKDLIKNGITL